jgi:hypothetical protein
MVPKLFGAGKSFKKLAAYVLHDADKAKTSERVGWTHTLNMAADTPALAVDEMLWTYRAAEELKREAGIRAGGRPLENPARHFSLNWHASENPSREHMIETVESFLKHMGWSEHQALIVNHTDRKHDHVHVVLNAVHPETGRALDTSFEKRRVQEWALAYEREQGIIFCDERLKPLAERSASPTRETWEKLRAYEREDDRAEQASTGFDYVKPSEGAAAKEWELLKSYQREQRQQFFAEGKEAYRQVRNRAYREVREEFRERWAGFYRAKREGMDSDVLSIAKEDLLLDQKETLDNRRKEASAELREQRDEIYTQLLESQREQRHELTERQRQGLRSYALLDEAYPTPERVPEADRNNAVEPSTEKEQPDRFPEIDRSETAGEQRSFERAERHRVRDPVDAVGMTGLGALGALASIGERLFDGLLGGGEVRTPALKKVARETPESDGEGHKVINTDDRETAEKEAKASHERWWQDRSRRWRGRD